MRGFIFLGVGLAAATTALLWRPEPPARIPLPEIKTLSVANWAVQEPILPIPPAPHFDPDKVALGEKLFRDVRISKNNSIACATCHHLEFSGADGLPRSIRMDGTQTTLHTPTIFNVSLNFQLFWDGRKKHLEEQIQTPRDTQTEWHEVLAKLRNDPDYKPAFLKAYPGEGMTEETLKNAIVIFERSLVTPNAPFDRYLRGQDNAISDKAKSGYRLFKDYGCISCHQGVNIGGNLYQKLGVIVDYYNKNSATDADLGRYNLTKLEADKFVFRVPSLRNVAVTAPYFHNGSIPSLREAILIMADHQLGRPISEQDVELIIEFLNTLTGEYRDKPLKADRS